VIDMDLPIHALAYASNQSRNISLMLQFPDTISTKTYFWVTLHSKVCDPLSPSCIDTNIQASHFCMERVAWTNLMGIIVQTGPTTITEKTITFWKVNWTFMRTVTIEFYLTLLGRFQPMKIVSVCWAHPVRCICS
jgi:hypothetical protein